MSLSISLHLIDLVNLIHQHPQVKNNRSGKRKSWKARLFQAAFELYHHCCKSSILSRFANIFLMAAISTQSASSSSSISSSTPQWKYDVFLSFRENFKDCIDKVQAWRTALREVASLKGWHVQDRPESQIIQNIVGELWHKLSYAFSEYTENLVGIISRAEKLESCLDLGSNNVRMVGIWGMGGIEMGKNIVYEECPKEPGKRGKLWLFKDINDVLTENTGTKAIQGIVLKLHKQKEALHKQKVPKYLPNALRFLDWSEYPSKYFPPSSQQKFFDSLKFISLKKSLKLIETPDFNKIPNLEKLVLKDHTWLLFFVPQSYEKEDMKSLCECDANGFSQIGIKIESLQWDLPKEQKVPAMVKKCGLRMVYKKDIDDLNFNNSMAAGAAAEGYKGKRTLDEYDGAGSSNYEPHPKRIERVKKFMAQGNSNCEESSEDKECAEELGD
ncbi:hypothetical protein CMV_015010 [Castanea mollissima]|uniref:TIR domain-containing protein n=1 Tax=Castanea mollissima TaxID=60419 RepID=A0A8J4RBC8_9ROSI|nr:hypothetical protein CMV_015010 [Castanea mollissima]